MTEADPEIRDLLQRAKSGFSPEQEDERRVRGRLVGALHAPLLGQTLEWRTPWWKAGAMKGALLGLAVGAAAGASVGYHVGTGRGHDQRVKAEQPSSAVDLRRPSPERDDETTENAEVSSPRSGSVVRKELERLQQPEEYDGEPHGQRSTKRPFGSGSSAQGPDPEGDLLDEVQQVRRVQRALAKGNAALALMLLDELDRRIPHGRLAEERAAGRAIARCQLKPGEAAQAAADFQRRFSPSVHDARVRSVCTPPEAEEDL